MCRCDDIQSVLVLQFERTSLTLPSQTPSATCIAPLPAPSPSRASGSSSSLFVNHPKPDCLRNSGLGHLAIQFARKLGFHTIALSTSTSKRDLALSLGAHEFIAGTAAEQAQALQERGGARVIICTAPDAQAMSALAGGLDYDGELVVVGASGAPVSIPIGEYFRHSMFMLNAG